MAKDIDFDKQLEAIINPYEKKVNNEVAKVTKEYSQKMVNDVKNNTPVNSGRLRDDWKAELTDAQKQEYTIYAPKEGFRAHFLEFGTYAVSARPFMRPAFDSVVAKYTRELKRTLKG